ncbi:anti-sigma factor antagonist [Bacillus sp. HMF5848]|uniref:STAS domain-containing protein n=1 Tax=Bacillus sp. HMF5848 TaxID=2495421 RepID=UPI000F7850CA|nr:STAS domain-containing protein [Bacillus sp. HMF5848]RSK27389.1 anti-sigma factor antagonist [Bacillus sp. HMF5848]
MSIIVTVNVNEEIALLSFSEDITIKNVERFKQLLTELLKQPQDKLLLDLTDVNYLNSASLGYMADTFMKARKMRKEFVITGINSQIEEIFRIVKFSSFMKLFHTMEESIAYYNSNGDEGL